MHRGAGVVDEKAHRTQRVVRDGEKPGDVLIQRHVGLHGDGARSCLACRLDDPRGGRLGLAVVHHHVVTELRQKERRGGADAPSRSGDDGDGPLSLMHAGDHRLREAVRDQEKRGAGFRRPFLVTSAQLQAPAIHLMNFGPTDPMPVMPSKPTAVLTVTRRDAQLPLPSQ